jgi:carboxyl-terminal processing protease
MKKKKLLWVVVALVAVNFLVGLQVLGKLSEGETAGLAKLDLIPQAMSIIQNNYVDSVDTEKLVHGAIRGMMDSLDIHSQFLPPVAVQNMQVDTTGTFGGLGIEITKREGFVTVISAIVGTPAYREGLMAGDRIVKIDEDTLDNPDLNDVVLKLRGEPGTKVSLMIVRYDPALRRDTIKTITITRAIIKVESVAEPRILKDSIGYVKVTQFQERTPADLSRVLDDLEAQGMDSLILDLRDNPGGLLISAVKVTDLFLPAGHVIVSTKGRRPAQNQKYLSENAGTHRMYPLAVLINGASASGSEIVAGAIKDLKRGVLVGDKSYGKGSVQTILRLGRDTALRLTTAKYYTPSGVSIQDTGVEPNVSVPVTYEQEMERRRQRYKAMEEALDNGNNGTEPKKPSAEGETPSDQNKSITDLPGKESEKEEEFVDIQLQEAVRILKALKAIGADKMFVVAPVETAEAAN